MVRFFPSAADLLRKRLQALPPEDTDQGLPWDEADDVAMRRMAVGREIGKLAVCARDQSKQSDQASKLLALKESIPDIEYAPYLFFAGLEINKLRALFDADGPLALPDDQTPGVAPFNPGGQWQRCWLNFWKRHPDAKPDANMRLYWEGYRSNQNLTFLEDFETSEAGQAGSATFLENGRIDLNTTAFDAYLKDIEHLAPDLKFQWVGDLVTKVHIWVIPASQAVYSVTGDRERTRRVIGMLRRHFLKEPFDEQPEHLQELRTTLEEIGHAYFAAQDPTRHDDLDLMCAITRVADGRAFMFADRVHRMHASDSAPARRVIVFDIAMNADERGRVVKGLCDLFTYHTLAQRDYPAVQEITQVIGAIQEELSAISAEFGEASNQMLSRNTTDGIDSQFGKQLDNTLNRLHRLTAVLGAADLFVKDGVRSAAKAARTYLKLEGERLRTMQPRPFSTFRGLEAISGPFSSVVGVFEDVSDRFNHCEERLSDLTSLISATLARIHAKQVEHLTEQNINISRQAAETARQSLWTAKAATFMAILTVFISAASVFMEYFLIPQRAEQAQHSELTTEPPQSALPTGESGLQ